MIPTLFGKNLSMAVLTIETGKRRVDPVSAHHAGEPIDLVWLELALRTITHPLTTANPLYILHDRKRKLDRFYTFGCRHCGRTLCHTKPVTMAEMHKVAIAQGCLPRYVIDHVRPLECEGADDPSNMQWQTIADGKAKDKTERYCR